MAMDPSVVINLAAEFTGKKAFKQADSATDKLTKGVKNLAGTFGIAFSATAVLAFAKASVKAAADDEKAQKQLALALQNVGLGRDAASAERFIQQLQSEFGVVDDKLRPAYQKLAIATRSSSESQKLLSLALDISAGTGKDLEGVTSALSKAYLGSNTSLSKLGVGISKADLKTKSFEEITSQLAKTFKGAATTSANTFAGSMAKLGVATNNVKEIIGKGIIDSLQMLSSDHSVDNLAKSMEDLALYTANVIRGIGTLTQALANINAAVPAWMQLDFKKVVMIANPQVGALLNLLDQLNAAGAKALRITEYALQKNPIQAGTYLVNQKKTTALTKEQQKAQDKILADKKSQAILDKANRALGKGTDLFNMDVIQLQAAMVNQAEQLGKVTSQAQLLMITNDIARLKIKQDIANLEDAIASKDDARITAATNQLNTDLKIYSALTNQSLKLADIKSILDSLLPKDLINLANLQSALDLLAKFKFPTLTLPSGQVIGGTTGGGGGGGTSGGGGGGNSGAIGSGGAGTTTDAQKWAEEIAAQAAATAAANAAVSLTSQVAQGSFAMGIGAGLSTAAAISGARYAAQGAASMGGGYVINVYANTIANPDELTGLIQDAIIRLNKQGDYITTAGAL